MMGLVNLEDERQTGALSLSQLCEDAARGRQSANKEESLTRN